MVTCASSDYIAAYGRPRRLDQLDRHRAVNFLASSTGRPVPFQFLVNGVPRSFLLKGTVSVTTADAYNACALQGLGLIQTARVRLSEPLADGRLVEVLSRWRPAPAPVSVLYPRQRHLSPRVRAFIDWLVESMAPYAD